MFKTLCGNWHCVSRRRDWVLVLGGLHRWGISGWHVRITRRSRAGLPLAGGRNQIKTCGNTVLSHTQVLPTTQPYGVCVGREMKSNENLCSGFGEMQKCYQKEIYSPTCSRLCVVTDIMSPGGLTDQGVKHAFNKLDA